MRPSGDREAMRSIVDTLLVDETLRHLRADAQAGAYSNMHLERVAIRHLFGARGLAFAEALVREAERP